MLNMRGLILGRAEGDGLGAPPGRKKCAFILTGYCHGCNTLGNCEMQYIKYIKSIQYIFICNGKIGLRVYFIASNSVLCVCVCLC